MPKLAADAAIIKEKYDTGKLVGFDGDRPGVVAIGSDPETNDLVLSLRVDKYSKFIAAVEQLSAIPLMRVAAVMGEEGVVPNYGRNTGSNVSVRTSDGMLAKVNRGPDVGDEPNTRSTAVGQGIRPDHIVAGMWDPRTTALNGLESELGIRAGEIIELRPTYVVQQVPSGTVSVCFHADVALTFEQVWERWSGAKERDENYGLVALPFRTVDEARDAFYEDVSQSSWGIATTLGALGIVHGREIVRGIMIERRGAAVAALREAGLTSAGADNVNLEMFPMQD